MAQPLHPLAPTPRRSDAPDESGVHRRTADRTQPIEHAEARARTTVDAARRDGRRAWTVSVGILRATSEGPSWVACAHFVALGELLDERTIAVRVWDSGLVVMACEFEGPRGSVLEIPTHVQKELYRLTNLEALLISGGEPETRTGP